MLVFLGSPLNSNRFDVTNSVPADSAINCSALTGVKPPNLKRTPLTPVGKLIECPNSHAFELATDAKLLALCNNMSHLRLKTGRLKLAAGVRALIQVNRWREEVGRIGIT